MLLKECTDVGSRMGSGFPPPGRLLGHGMRAVAVGQRVAARVVAQALARPNVNNRGPARGMRIFQAQKAAVVQHHTASHNKQDIPSLPSLNKWDSLQKKYTYLPTLLFFHYVE